MAFGSFSDVRKHLIVFFCLTSFIIEGQPLVEKLIFHKEDSGCSPLDFSKTGPYIYLSGVFGRFADQMYVDSAYGGFIAQYDKSGKQKWTRQFYTRPGLPRVIPLQSASDSEGNVYSGFERFSKFNVHGDLVFDFPLDTAARITNILVDQENNVILIGSCGRFSFLGYNLKHDGFIAKLSGTGQVIWIKDFFNDGGSIGNGVNSSLDDEGNIYVTASFSNDQYFFEDSYISGDYCDGVVGKISGNGELRWVKVISGFGVQSPSCVRVNSLGQVYVGGDFDIEARFSNDVCLPSGSRFDIFIARYDQLGNCVWARQGYSLGGEEVFDLQSDSQGNIYIAGSSRQTDGFTFGQHTVYGIGKYVNNSFLAEVDSSGNVLGLWSSTNANVANYLNCLATDDEGMLYAAGGCGEGQFSLLGENIATDRPATFIMRLNPFLSTGFPEVKTTNQIIRLFPNPAEHELTIESTGCTKLNCRVFDVHGKEMVVQLHQSDDCSVRLDVEHFPRGTYLIEATTAEGVERHKFLVH